MIERSLSVDTDDNVLECVRDGSVNIVISTFEIEEEIYVRRCSLLIRLGMPKDFNGYINVKKKVRSSEAKVVFLVNEEDKYKEEERFKVFHEIEHILLEKCYNTSRPSCHEIQKLFQQEPSEAYEPFGKDLLSSISLVNSYCSKFPSSGVGAPVPYCRTQEIWSDSKVQFVSTLYLPRNSPVYWPIQVTSTYSRNDMNKETLRKATIKSEMLVAMETCRQLHKAGELDDDLQPISRFQVFRLTAENEKCNWEVVDCGMGIDGSVKRNRVYIRKFPAILEDNLPVCGGPSFLYSITMELTKPLTFERAARSRSKGHPSGDCYSLGILCRRTLPKIPGMVIFDRAGEVTATIAECRRNPFVPSLDQLALIQRFTGFIFKEIAKPGNTSTKTFPKFDPSVATSGYYVVLLKNSEDGRSSRADGLDAKEIAFDFMQSIEKALGSFDSPADPAPAGIQDMEKFADAVVTAVYNDKRLRYYVADICYDRSPVDPFPNQDAAATFAEYYQKRYGIQVTLDQPLLDVDHISSRLNFLLPRYQSIKGHELSFPWKDSRRSQKAQLYVVPELCSIHPLPAYLWRRLFLLPSVLYRMESLLVAEEFRSLVARGLGRGAVDWPNEVPLPLVTLSETMGEDMLSQSNSFLEDSKKRDPSVVDSDKTVNLCFQPASGIEEDKRNPRHSTDLIKEMIVQRRDFEEVQQTAAELTPRNKKPSPLAASEVKVDFEDFNWSYPAKHDTSVDKEIGESSNINIWTDSRLSRLYQTCGPSSTLILRALTPGSAGDVFSLERLEMLGDSFIKYAISCSVFFQQPHENEGKLSFIRGLKVSNRQLFYLARRRGLPSYMFPHMFDLFVNWLPPGFYYEDNDDTEGVNESELLLMPVESSQNIEDEEEEEDECIFAQEGVLGETDNPEASIGVEDHSSSIQLSPILHQRCSDKAVADALEALVGAYLLTMGTEGAWSFLQWLGIDPNKQEDGRDVQRHSSSFVEDSSTEEGKEFYSTAGTQEMSERPCSALQSCNVQCTSTVKDKDFDSTASRQEVSKRPCSVFQTSDESLSQWTCEILQIAPLEKALNCSGKGAPDASGRRKNKALPDKMHDPLLEKRTLWTNSLWTPHEIASNSQPSFHVSDDSLFQEKTALYSLHSNSAFLPSEESSSAEFKAIEEVLKYKFHNRLLLEQAFTHTSLPRDYNAVRSSYEQLEFLGDALLDFLVTRYLYIHERHKSPGDLTDLRSAVVNNFSFAALAVKLGFAKHLRSLSPQLFKIVNKFIEKFEEKLITQRQTSNNEICSSVIVLANEDSEEFVEVEVPKVLGDLFEAVAGALYVDCGQDLSKVWEIYLPILKPSIDYHSANPPMSATRKLLEMKPNASKFAPVERMVDGTFRSSLTVAGFGTFIGIGRNFQIAKSTAAQKALAALRKRKLLKE
ncbi:endoribonuclease Dicer-like isoform X2 [Montipora capricornis]